MQVSTFCNSPIFDKYVVNNASELEHLNNQGLLKGAIIITGDKKHVGLHKVFCLAQKIKQFFEKIRGIFTSKRNLDTNLCHGMVAVGWDNTWSEKKNANNNRPLLAHSVLDGVKLNAVDYFNNERKDVDHMIVYVPKDPALRDEYAKNAKMSAEISTDKKNRSKFAWGNLLTSIFKRQIYKQPTKLMGKRLAYTVTDLLLERKLSKGSNEKKSRSFYCMEYAIEVLQASVLTNALNAQDKRELMYNGDKILSREEIAKKIYSSLKNGKIDDKLSKAYWESHVCTKMNANGILSSYAANVFDKISEAQPVQRLIMAQS
jgi:hypothetical protein